MARRLDRLARLWEALDARVDMSRIGFCLDTCHAHAGGEELAGVVDRVKAITGRVDLVHANDSRDEFDSGADRHANFGSGQIDRDDLVAVVSAAGAPVVCETPGGAEGQGADIAWLRERLPGLSPACSGLPAAVSRARHGRPVAARGRARRAVVAQRPQPGHEVVDPGRGVAERVHDPLLGQGQVPGQHLGEQAAPGLADHGVGRPPVGRAAAPADQPALHQPVDHPGDAARGQGRLGGQVATSGAGPRGSGPAAGRPRTRPRRSRSRPGARWPGRSATPRSRRTAPAR